jgi:hypothetical protein
MVTFLQSYVQSPRNPAEAGLIFFDRTCRWGRPPRLQKCSPNSKEFWNSGQSKMKPGDFAVNYNFTEQAEPLVGLRWVSSEHRLLDLSLICNTPRQADPPTHAGRRWVTLGMCGRRTRLCYPAFPNGVFGSQFKIFHQSSGNG